MQYELRTQVIEPSRKTFDHLVARYGDRPASRYEEGTIDLQAKENFHYRPLWDPSKEIYDESFSVFRLTDPYSFTDPRQYYYAPYVTSRAAMSDAFGATLDYLESRNLLVRLPDEWRTVLAELVIPLRHYESGAQLVSTQAARFGFGATVTQCAAYAAFDRIGNAQLISRAGIALDGGTAVLLGQAKESWMRSEALQPMRRLVEETIVEPDWGVGLVTLDVVDQVLYHVLFTHLDDLALTGGAPAYSLVAQHLTGWLEDQRRWVDALYKAWAADPDHGEENSRLLAQTAEKALSAANDAVTPIAAVADGLVTGAAAVAAVDEASDRIRAALAPATA